MRLPPVRSAAGAPAGATRVLAAKCAEFAIRIRGVTRGVENQVRVAQGTEYPGIAARGGGPALRLSIHTMGTGEPGLASPTFQLLSAGIHA